MARDASVPDIAGLVVDATPRSLSIVRQFVALSDANRKAVAESGVLDVLSVRLRSILQNPSRGADNAPPADVLLTYSVICGSGAETVDQLRVSGVNVLAAEVIRSAVTDEEISRASTAVVQLCNESVLARKELHAAGVSEAFALWLGREGEAPDRPSSVIEKLCDGLRALAESCPEVQNWMLARGLLDHLSFLICFRDDIASAAAGVVANAAFGNTAVQLRLAGLEALPRLPGVGLAGKAPPSPDAVRAMLACVAGCPGNLQKLSESIRFPTLIPVFHQLMAAGALDFAARMDRSGVNVEPFRVTGNDAVPFAGVATAGPASSDGVFELTTVVDGAGAGAGFEVFSQVQDISRVGAGSV
eukprot:Hpha_TRINITY_DN32343_c0_g1::TRINITY_DN32343_c0_g1_i1::g.145692::m.145692